MRTTVLTRQRLTDTEALVIYRRGRAYHVAHVDAAQQCTPLPESMFWTYEAAQTRLQAELRAYHATVQGR